jgi:hypothetical protein
VWSEQLPYITKALNSRPLKRIGYLSPNDINSPFDNIKVQEAEKEHNIVPYSEPDIETQEENQKKYENSSKNEFQVGTFVYLDRPANIFRKSFHVQVTLRIITLRMS